MAVLAGEELAHRYGAETVFEKVSVRVHKGDRIAFIGLNGSGKSTLLRILAGLQEPTSGQVVRARSVRVGYLAQEPQLQSDVTLFEEMLKVFAKLREQEREMRRLEQELSLGTPGERLLQRYDALLESFRHGGGYEYKNRIYQVLAGVGFHPEEDKKPVAHLSGGERARAALARLLLEEPDILLLDEPTNHLDIQALEWLEEYLSRWKGAFIVVSHDRYFLDRLAQKVWELEFGRLYEYPGNYSKHSLLRHERLERQWKLYEEQQEFIKTSEEFIRRNIAGGHFRANQAQARQKTLEKLERIPRPVIPKKIHVWIDARKQSGRQVLRARELAISYPGTMLFRCKTAHLQRGERAALIGPNGSGKSSFLKAILGELHPLEGTLELGQNVEVAYFRQSQTELEETDKTVLEVLLGNKDQTISEGRDFLGQFLFSGDDVFKKVSELSGGERSRVALAQLAQLGGNFLLLDEPTNHLDIDSREVLQEALKEYEGTILLVSHDRYLIQAIATQIWEIRDGELKIYHGDYESYRMQRDLSAGPSPEVGAKNFSPLREGVGVRSGERPRRISPGKEQRQRERQRAKLAAREAELMGAVTALENEIAQIEKEMEAASYAGDHQRLRELTTLYRQKRQELETASEQWSQAAEELARYGL
jgi:ATP-binding cassette subfamily F protein 3